MSDTSKVPYLQAYGNITKALIRIQDASIPSKFTQDFLSTKLNMPGGSPRPVITFLKRAGFLAADGTPTGLYSKFKNKSIAGGAAAQGLKNAYGALYEINEYAHDLKDEQLKGIILQVTGLESDSKLIPAMAGSFKALRSFATFDQLEDVMRDENRLDDGTEPEQKYEQDRGRIPVGGLRLGYTVNLNLPNTSDIAVFNAIFKSLKEHFL